MKRFKKIISLLAIAAMIVTMPLANTMTVSAAEPMTYYIGFNPDRDDWRWQRGTGTFDLAQEDLSLDDLNTYVQDGDIIVVYGGGETRGLEFNVDAYLSNVTVLNVYTIALIGANGIGEFYSLMDSVCAVNSNVTNAYVYDSSRVSFNKNVTNLEIICPPDEFNAVTSLGTVGHAKRHYDGYVMYEVYNVAAGKFSSTNADMDTDPQYYSTTPTGTPAASQTTTSTSSANDYDDVPKTGESNMIFLLLGISAISFLGSRRLRRA